MKHKPFSRLRWKRPVLKTGVQLALKHRSGFGLNEVIGIAAAILIAVVVVIPGLRSFAEEVISKLGDWWNTMSAELFSSN